MALVCILVDKIQDSVSLVLHFHHQHQRPEDTLSKEKLNEPVPMTQDNMRYLTRFLLMFIEQKLTSTNEYPIQRELHPLGHSGIFILWLCTDMTLEGASQTAHRLTYLSAKSYHEETFKLRK